MPITRHQKLDRKRYLGSSDMAAIMGLDPWRNAADVRAEKRGEVPELEANEAMKIGTLLEPACLAWAQERLGPLRRNQFRRHSDLPLAAHIDAIVVSDMEPVEAKTTGLLYRDATGWGMEGTDEVPDRVIIQAHVHMMCLAPKGHAERCHVPTFIGGRGFLMFIVPYAQEIADEISEQSARFWHDCVLGDRVPDVLPSTETLHRRLRKEDTVSTVDPQLVARFIATRQARLDADKDEKQAQRALLAAMGDADCASASDDGTLPVITYRQFTRPQFDTKAFKASRPELAKDFTKTISYRRWGVRGETIAED